VVVGRAVVVVVGSASTTAARAARISMRVYMMAGGWRAGYAGSWCLRQGMVVK
jgi:hypothetical protein